MFIPIGDAPNPKGIPFVTYTLIAVNVAVYLFVNLLVDLTYGWLDPRIRYH